MNLSKPHRIIIFSKDRPWQLQQLIRSMQLNVFTDSDMDIIILYKASNREFMSGYQLVQQDLDTYLYQVSFHWWKDGLSERNSEEGDEVDSSSDFTSLLEAATKQNNCGSSLNFDLIMFLTDDCILLQPLHELWCLAKYTYCQEKHLMAFCSRLHPGISYSQTSQTISLPPPSQTINYIQLLKDHPADAWSCTGALLYPISCASREYSYPFDLSGGIYKKSLIRHIMNDIQINKQQLLGAYSHPNCFEVNGNRILFQKMMETNKTHACVGMPSVPSLLILAINRVQDVYHAPLACGQEESQRMAPHRLLDHLHRGDHLNLDQYKNTMFHSSHIGDFYLTTNQNTSSKSLLSQEEGERDFNESSFNSVPIYKLSILIPVHIGPPSAAALAIQSVLYPILFENDLSPIQIVIVDDRCTDGSIDAMLKQINTFFLKYQDDVTVRMLTLSEDDIESKSYTYDIPIMKKDKWVDIIVVPSSITTTNTDTTVGLGAALNVGLKCCQSEYVARMDADDVCCPNRLSSQLSCLRQNTDIHIVGTNGIIFSDNENVRLSCSNSSRAIHLPYDSSGVTHPILSTSIQPTQCGFVDWAMMFSCVLTHPSVMFRKSIVLNESGYGTDKKVCSYTEDYDLWLRVQRRYAKCISNIPMIGVCHRKHSNRNHTDKRQRQQIKESINLSYKIMMEYISSEYDSKSSSLDDYHAIEAIKFPNNLASLEILNQASLILVQLEKAFLQKLHSRLTAHEISLIRNDCTERIGELVTIGIQKFGRDASKGYAWSVWEERDPNRSLDRISLLLSCVT